MDENNDDSYMVDVGENRYFIQNVANHYTLYCGGLHDGGGNFVSNFNSQAEAKEYIRRLEGYPLRDVPLP